MQRFSLNDRRRVIGGMEAKELMSAMGGKLTLGDPRSGSREHVIGFLCATQVVWVPPHHPFEDGHSGQFHFHVLIGIPPSQSCGHPRQKFNVSQSLRPVHSQRDVVRTRMALAESRHELNKMRQKLGTESV
jgi:hypothetical protein